MIEKSKWIVYILSAILSFFIIDGLHVEAVVKDDTVPKGTYYFTRSGVISSHDGVERPDLFNQILKGRQLGTIDEFNSLASNGFFSKDLSGDLETNSGFNLWEYDLQQLKQRTTGTIVTLKQGSTEYKLYIPRGINRDGEPVNTAIINNAIAGIERYKKAIQEGILAGAMNNSINVYSMYADKQLLVSEIMERNQEGVFEVGSSLAKYSLDYYFHPIFGKMDIEEAKKADQKYWENKISSVPLEYKGDGKVQVTLDPEYLNFVMKDSEQRQTLVDADNNKIVSSDGVGGFTPSLAGTKFTPDSMVDVSFRLMLPSKFSKKVSGTTYNINDGVGYKIMDDFRLVLSHRTVFKKDESGLGYSNIGDFAMYDIDSEGLVLYHTTLDEEDNFSLDGRKVGVVIPLWFKEVVADTRSSGGTFIEENLYYTGRKLKFNNDYSGKISLDMANKNLFGVDELSGGLNDVYLRYFSFLTDGNAWERSHHKSLPTAPSEFYISTSFVSSDHEDGVKGFVMYRNNWYVEDTDLLSWLDSSQARSMVGVKAEKLKEIILGLFEVENTELTYEQWKRLQEIKSELDGSFIVKFKTVIGTVSILFGIFLLFYAILLVIFYFMDIFNIILEFSLLHAITFKRLYPIASKDDIEYIGNQVGDVKYVTMWQVLVLAFITVGVGLVFIYGNPIIEMIVWLYYKISSLVGGI